MDTPESFYLRFGAFELDEQDARLTREGRPVLLAPKAFAVLCALARRPGHLLTKNALLDAVWGHQHVSDSVLKTTIRELRAALSDDARRPDYIETVSRRGYRFVGAVRTGAGRNSHATASAPPARDNARPPGPPLIGRQPALERAFMCLSCTATPAPRTGRFSDELRVCIPPLVWISTRARNCSPG